jgi:putative cell wall-binding protein
VAGMTATRVAGADRYATAAAISRLANADPSSIHTVYLVTGKNFPDALSVAPAAARPGYGIILIPGDSFTQASIDELRRLNPKLVIFVGGSTSVSSNLVPRVRDLLPGAAVSRIAGADRYETSVLIARHAFPDADEAFVASGESFPDALSAAPAAALANAPVILVPRSSTAAVTAAWMREARPARVTIAGGTPSVSAAVAQQITAAAPGAAVTRIAGSDRYETNRLLAKVAANGPRERVLLASGERFPDALAAAAAAPKVGPLLLTPSSCLQQGTFDMLDDTYSPSRLYVLGSAATLSESVLDQSICGSSPSIPTGFPSAATTGVPEGVTLTPYTGTCAIGMPDVVIDAKVIDCDIMRVRAPGLVITNSIINGRIYNDDNGSFSMTDSEVRAPLSTGTGVGHSNFVLTRVEVTGGSRSVTCGACTVQDSYLHGQYTDLRGIDHGSAIRMGAGGSILRNTITCDARPVPPDAGCSAALTGYGDFGVVERNTIDGNLIDGGPAGSMGFCAYGGSTPGKPFSEGVNNIRFTNNVFMRGPSGRCGIWGPIVDFDSAAPGNVWRNNTWDDGTPVPPAN